MPARHRLNLFQRAILHWRTLHPYCAAHVVASARPLDRERLRASIAGVLEACGLTGFALDAQGDIYAEVPTSSTAFQIEEFLAGATTPTRIIGGSNTTLTVPAGITVLP